MCHLKYIINAFLYETFIFKLSGGAMGSFKDIDSFETFSVSTISGGAENLYANGLQQITVYVKMVALDKDANYVILDKDIELIERTILINYHTQKPLKLLSGNDAQDTGEWSYTLKQGKYQQLSSSNAHGLVSAGNNSDKINEFNFYIQCPEDELQRTISVAISVTLDNGKTINSTGTDGFDSSITVSAHDPLVYKVSAVGNNINGLLIRKEQKFNYPSGGDSKLNCWGNNYHVTISSSQNPAGKMKDMLFYPEGEVAQSNTWPRVGEYFTRIVLKSEELCFSASVYGEGRGACYIYDENSPYRNTLGMGGYNTAVSSDIESDAFNFSCVHYNTYDEDYVGGQSYLPTMHCEFRDQYGNFGRFKAAAIDEANDEFHRASEIVFLNY